MQALRSELDIVYHVDLTRDDSQRFTQAAQWVVQAFGLTSLTASIAIVDDTTITQLNRDHLNHDWPTDVISFVFDSSQGKVDGEIIVSSDTAYRLHTAAGWSLEDEILLYVVHGLLHLAGMDDTADDGRQAMRLAERQCLLDLGVEGATEHLDRWVNISN